MSTIEDRLATIEANQSAEKTEREKRDKLVDANLGAIIRMLQNVGRALNLRDEIRADLRTIDELNGHDTIPAPPPEGATQ